MDVASKYQIVEMIIQSNNDTLLNQIKTLLDSSEDDFWGGLPADVKKAINRSKTELDKGKGIGHDVVMEEIKVRYLKS